MPCFSSSVLTSSVHSASSSRVGEIRLPSNTTTTTMMPNQQPPPPPPPRRRHPIGPGGTRPMLREQDQYLPIGNIIRIMRRILPAHATITDDAKETIQECVSEYISFITGEANDRCKCELRKTVTADDILWAMRKLGFEYYIEPLAVYLSRYREQEGDRCDPSFLLKRAMMHHDHDIGGPSEPSGSSGPMMMMPPPPPLAPLAPLAPMAPVDPAPMDPAPVPNMAYNNFQMLQGDDQNMNQLGGMYDAGASSPFSDILNDYFYGSGSGQGSGGGGDGDGDGGDGEDGGAAQSGKGEFVPIYSPFN